MVTLPIPLSIKIDIYLDENRQDVEVGYTYSQEDTL